MAFFGIRYPGILCIIRRLWTWLNDESRSQSDKLEGLDACMACEGWMSGDEVCRSSRMFSFTEDYGSRSREIDAFRISLGIYQFDKK